MLDLGLAGFFLLMLGLGLRHPFMWVLTYLYVDIIAPQRISWFLLASIPVSLIAFVAAFGGWLIIDRKRGGAFGFRQVLIVLLLIYCGISTLSADFYEHALAKWDWVWKALLFAAFLPLTLRTRLRIEAAALFIVLSVGAIVISAGIKTVVSGGGYGTLQSFVGNNTGLYEGSILSCAAITLIPLIFWHMKHGTVFPRNWMVKLFGLALTFACLLIPVGTQARTGLICIAVLLVLSLRTVKRRFLFIGLSAALGLIAIPFLPASFVERMQTIENHEADKSASTRVAVWNWTLDYVGDHPFGGGFDAYRGNRLRFETRSTEAAGGTTEVASQVNEDAARAYHSSYFEMLGEQGWPGLFIWLLLQFLGVWHMEKLRRRWKGRTGPDEQWQAPLASALQHAQLIYLAGSLFVGIAFLPYAYMLIGLQCGLYAYLRRADRAMLQATQPKPGQMKLKPLAPVSPA